MLLVYRHWLFQWVSGDVVVLVVVVVKLLMLLLLVCDVCVSVLCARTRARACVGIGMISIPAHD